MTVDKAAERQGAAPHGIMRTEAEVSAVATHLTALVPGFDTGRLVSCEGGLYLGQMASEGIPLQYRSDGKPFAYIDGLVEELGRDPGILYWLTRLKGQTLVDIGAGATAYGYRFAQAVRAKAYIGIEGYYPSALLQSIREQELQDINKIKSVPVAIIGEEMIKALERFPTDSVSVLASRIEPLLFRSGRSYDDMQRAIGYTEIVGKQIRRILHPEGLFISYKSEVYPTEHSASYDQSNLLRKYSKH